MYPISTSNRPSSPVPLKEALLKEDPLRENHDKHHIANHTDQGIKISQHSGLIINGKIVTYLSQETSELTAYHPIGQPDVICFEQKTKVGDSDQVKRFFSKLMWGKPIYKIDKASTCYFPLTVNPLGLNLNLPLPVHKPFLLKTPTIDFPKEISEKDQEHLNILLKEIAPEANLSATPTWLIEEAQGCKIKFLNLTHFPLKITPQLHFYINGLYSSLHFSQDDCCNIVYTIKGLPKLICMETKDDNQMNLVDRFFFKNTGSKISHITSANFFNAKEAKLENLFALQAQPIDYKGLVENDSNIKTLAEDLLLEADSYEHPQSALFQPRSNSTSRARRTHLTVVNQTAHKITFDINRRLCIDGQAVATFAEDDCQILAYKLKNNPFQIYFEQKDLRDTVKLPRFFCQLAWSASFTKISKCRTAFERARKEIAFQTLWRGSESWNSPLFKEDFPKELLALITESYKRAP